jgi:hypothetical protein
MIVVVEIVRLSGLSLEEICVSKKEPGESGVEGLLQSQRCLCELVVHGVEVFRCRTLGWAKSRVEAGAKT